MMPVRRTASPKRIWTEAEDATIREHYRDKTAREIAGMLGVPIWVVERRKRRLGCASGYIPPSGGIPTPPKPRGFTKAQIAWAIANLGTDPEARMIAHMVAESWAGRQAHEEATWEDGA